MTIHRFPFDCFVDPPTTRQTKQKQKLVVYFCSNSHTNPSCGSSTFDISCAL